MGPMWKMLKGKVGRSPPRRLGQRVRKGRCPMEKIRTAKIKIKRKIKGK